MRPAIGNTGRSRYTGSRIHAKVARGWYGSRWTRSTVQLWWRTRHRVDALGFRETFIQPCFVSGHDAYWYAAAKPFI